MKIVNINSNLFSVDGDIFQKGLYTVDYKDKGVKIIQLNTGLIIGGGASYKDWKFFTDSNDDKFDSYDDFILALNGIILGSAINQGPQGPQGVPGPVGPAGLIWRGAWLTETAYAKDDAVGYSGASYFCISPTSGTTTPNLDAANWALLASQGAPGTQGAQGVQGPIGNTGAQGPQGPAGNSAETYISNLITGTSFPYPLITSNSVRVGSDATGKRVMLPANPALGTRVRVGNKSDFEIIVYANVFNKFYVDGIGSVLGNITDIEIPSKEEYVFVYITEGVWSAYPNVKPLPYKVYTALISHGAGNENPTAVVLQNTIGEISFVYQTANTYAIQSSELFTSGKTAIFLTSPNSPLMKVGAKSNNANFISLQTDNDSFSGLNLEIRVYN